ncbi:3-deoxy-manno-octulosonate cytidylyltransferase [Daejeonella sp.]|uniref:3-deoxy-manno-octulosonate cytidylyltransferase n=1 Tax=Daejeonella sp. TaxID=2805397 RepID=UPI0030C529B9
MKILGIIPARFASSRFPGKPLADIAGKSMIRRVYEQCRKSSSLHKVIVATDDQRILDHVKSFGGDVVMTSEDHVSGTDRCNEVASQFPEFDICINIQGDEPLIDPLQIDLVCQCFMVKDVELATLVKKITITDELFNPNTPKVIFNKDMEAIYFSRNTIPFLRNSVQDNWLKDHTYYKHIGIYGYRTSTLAEITRLEMSALEKAEALEQLRWVENGYKIKVAVTDKESQAIDTPEDLKKLLSHLKPDT